MCTNTEARNSIVKVLLALAMGLLALGYAASARAVDAGDNFADRLSISGTSGQATGSTVGATREAGEPLHAGLEGGGSVWRSWTAPATGPVTFDTLGSGFDTMLAVYVGTQVDALTVVASSDDIQWPSNLLSSATFSAQTGVTYAVAIDGFQGETGDFVLNWQQDPIMPTEHTLTLNANGYGRARVNGNIQSLPYTGTFDANAQVLVEAVPLGGWIFAGWSGDLTGTTNPSVVKMTGDWTISLSFEPDPSLSSVCVPWYVDTAGTAQKFPPLDGKVTSIVYLSNMQDAALDCYIEYYTQDGIFIGPLDVNEFSIPAQASIAFRPVADDPASVPGGQEAPTGQAVPNRPLNTENGNDGKANGSLVVRFAGPAEILKGQVQSASLGRSMGAFATAYQLPGGVSAGSAEPLANTLSVPWYVDNAAPALGIPPESGNTCLVYLHNNRSTEVTCVIRYYTETGVFVGPSDLQNFTIPANASVAFRPAVDDPATVAGGQESALGLTVPNRPLNTDDGNDNKKNGSIRIFWLGQPTDVQGMVASYSYRADGGSFASSTMLPPAISLGTKQLPAIAAQP